MSSMNSVRFVNVSYTYPDSYFPVINNLTLTIPYGWTGIVGANGSGKTTFGKLAAGLLLPDKGSITRIDNIRSGYCSQTTNAPPDEMGDFFVSKGKRAGKLCSVLGLEGEWQERWNTLSHGERKKVQIAILLWLEPELLVLDEPTNHLDHKSAEIIRTALSCYEGIGILISHDRQLLNLLCQQSIFMEHSSVIMRPGNFDAGLSQKKLEEESKSRNYEQIKTAYKKAEKSARKLKENALKHSHKTTKRHIDKADHDAKAKIDLARLTSKDAKEFSKAEQMESRRELLVTEMDLHQIKKRTVEGFEFNGACYQGDLLFSMDTAHLKINPEYTLVCPDLRIIPSDRIGLTGENGSGKTTLLQVIRNGCHIPTERMIYIPQEFDKETIAQLVEKLEKLPNKEKGALLSIIYRLGSEPDRVLNSQQLSPGEARKLLFALGLLKEPYVIIMDEPTNHMDLPSIECLESALLKYQGALLIVSHDEEFLAKVIKSRWHIKQDGNNGIVEL